MSTDSPLDSNSHSAPDQPPREGTPPVPPARSSQPRHGENPPVAPGQPPREGAPQEPRARLERPARGDADGVDRMSGPVPITPRAVGDPAHPGGVPRRRCSIVVGVALDVPDVVVREAARFAASLGARLVFAYAEPSRYPVDVLPSGIITAMPIDPDLPESDELSFDPDLAARIRALVPDVESEFRALSGDPATQLGQLAEDLGSRAIVVGTRRPGFRSSVEEFFAGSVAVGLAHHQTRPVIVIPVTPRADARPWEAED